MDVALGGQGAPLVPLGEKHLFHQYRQFLNIGGICNIAIHRHDTISAFDVCPGNTLLNHFAGKTGFAYDEGGQLAASGKVHKRLLSALNRLPFLYQPPPKSLGTEHILRQWIPLIEKEVLSVQDILCTSVEHIAQQIARVAAPKNMLVTGGGAFNKYLIERLRHHLPDIQIDVPDNETVQYKEALIMGFLGLLRYLGRPNTLPQVTGASHTTIGGAIYLPPPTDSCI
jgi:anhydro-N-acetylmuramic acid kinase